MKERLETVPDAHVRIPERKELLKIFELVGVNVEAAEYFLQKFTEMVNQAGLQETSAKLIKQMQDFVTMLRYRSEGGTDPWKGDTPSNGFSNMHERLANDAVAVLGEAGVDSVNMDMAFNDLSEMLRGYKSEGKPLNPKLQEALDKLFNAWLAKDNIVTKNSTLYECNSDGTIKKDANGHEVRANTEKIKEKIEGLIAFIRDKGVQTTVNFREYPQKTPVTEEKTQAAQPEGSVSKKEPQAEAVQSSSRGGGIGGGTGGGAT